MRRKTKKEEIECYTYESATRGRVQVFCTRYQFLFLKLHYDINGLTADEYAEYKSYFSKAK